MNSLYQFNFSDYDLISVKKNGDMPKWCEHNMKSAHQHHNYSFKQLNIAHTRYNRKPFTIDLLQVNYLIETRPLAFTMNNSGSTMAVMLKGEVYIHSGKSAQQVMAGELLLSSHQSLSYTFALQSVKQSVLLITIDENWLKSYGADFPEIVNLATGKNDIYSGNSFLFRGVRKVEQWIRNIQHFPDKGIAAIDGNLRLHVALLLGYYDDALKQKRDSLAYRVKSYLDTNYRDNTLTVKKLAAQFYVTERTLSNHFSKHFNITIHRYYTELRMLYAIELINKYGLTPKEIYYKVGYNDESSFRYAYTRFVKKTK